VCSGSAQKRTSQPAACSMAVYTRAHLADRLGVAGERVPATFVAAPPGVTSCPTPPPTLRGYLRSPPSPPVVPVALASYPADLTADPRPHCRRRRSPTPGGRVKQTLEGEVTR